MFSSSPDTLFSRKHFYFWFLLSFQAGAINAGGFIACHRFVSHVTGFATHFGIEVIGGNLSDAIGMMSVPIFFLLGSVISAFVVDRRIQRREDPRYWLVLALITLCLVFVLVLGHNQYFGIFGAAHEISRDFFLLALLCLACGLQNAMITSASGAVVRTTHLTGITTDLGIGLVRVFSSSTSPAQLRRETTANRLRAGSILYFVLGSTIAAYLHLHFKYKGFLLPTGISTFLFALALSHSQGKSRQSSSTSSRSSV